MARQKSALNANFKLNSNLVCRTLEAMGRDFPWLAEKIGLCTGTVYAQIRHQRVPSEGPLRLMIEALNVSQEDLLLPLAGVGNE